MSETQEQIEAHNTRELWRDVANHLRAASECAVQAQAALDDLGEELTANHLDPVVESLNDVYEVASRNV